MHELIKIVSNTRPPWDDGSGSDYSSSYQDLATAIVLLAVKDYKKTLRAIWKNPKSESERCKLVTQKVELEAFFYSDEYQMYCNFNPDRLIKNCHMTAIEDEKKQSSDGIKERSKNS